MCNVFNSLRMKKKMKCKNKNANLRDKNNNFAKIKIMKKLQFSNIKDEIKFRSNFWNETIITD